MLGRGSSQLYPPWLRVKAPGLSGSSCQSPMHYHQVGAMGSQTCPAGQRRTHWGHACSLGPIPLGPGCFCGKSWCDVPQSYAHWAQPNLLGKAKFHTSVKIAGSRKYFNFLKTACIWLKRLILVIAIRCSCFAHISANRFAFNTGEKYSMALRKKLGMRTHPHHEESSPWQSLPLPVSAYLIYSVLQTRFDRWAHWSVPSLKRCLNFYKGQNLC